MSIFRRAAVSVLSCLMLATPVLVSGQSPSTGTPFDVSGADAAFLCEAENLVPAAEYNADDKKDIAGLTRLPALLMVCEQIDSGRLSVDDMLTVSEMAASVPGPTAFIEAYESMSAGDLLKAAVMINAGDAVYALAEGVAGNGSAFSVMLNQRLAELGVDAVYTDVVDDGVKLSARELAIIGSAIMKTSSFKLYSALYYDELTHSDGRLTELACPNKLIRSLPGCSGVATGSSPDAGYCGVFYVARGDTRFVCVTLGSSDSKTRFAAATGMIEYAFSSFRTVVTAKQGSIAAEAVLVRGGTVDSVDLVYGNGASLLLSQNDSHEAVRTIPDVLDAPVAAGDVVGGVDFVDASGNIIAHADVICPVDIPLATIWDIVLSVLCLWLV